MFQINDVYRPTRPLKEIVGLVRILESVGLEKVIFIQVDMENPTVPFAVAYSELIELLRDGSLEKAPDPFLRLTSVPTKLPPGVRKRYQLVVEATSTLSKNPALLHAPRTLAKEINAVAKSMGRTPRTVKRWILEWLQAGRNPAAAVRGFIESSDSEKDLGWQTSGAKRGPERTKPDTASDAPAHEIREVCKKAYTSYVKAQGMTWVDAYHEMLIVLCGIPEEEIEESKHGLLMDPVLIKKYRPPTWPQCRYVFRKLMKLEQELTQDGEAPRGNRGKATDHAPGPGFYEIDATFFQIQLVSRVTKSELVGRPTVYLIVDIFDGVIVGYAVTLENPSWAVAALALYNCFSDKAATFSRLGLPFTSADWPCRHLPTVLRADRAELISNMGMNFPTSGIRVEVAPSMTPIAKGTVEGKHSELKKERPGRFNLPGRFQKIRKRRQSDGKRDATLDILEFERILIEIILDINGEPVEPNRIPPDALPRGAQVGSRIGLHEWALVNRAGFTRQMGPHFPFEHLLTNAIGRVTPLGIKLENETFNCDRLRELGYLTIAVGEHFNISVSYHPNYAGELFFFDKANDQWISAANIDPEVDRYKMTFAEAKEYRALQALTAAQAGLNNHARRRKRMPIVRSAIKAAIAEKKSLGIETSASEANIRENRSKEKAAQRSAGLHGALPKPASSDKSAVAAPPLPIDQPGQVNFEKTSQRPNDAEPAGGAISLWDEVPDPTKS